jgi:CDP-paratose 2-epimerase
MSKTILIAGGCGFVGSNLAISLKEKYPSHQIISLDNLKRSGSELNIPRLREHGIRFMHGDIRNAEDLIIDEKIDVIIDAAAEPSVMAGIGTSTDYLVKTNFNGTINLLNVATTHKADFIFLSTSRVYPINTLEKLAYKDSDSRFILDEKQLVAGASANGIAENFPLEGARSFYGTTKLASELMITEYQEFFGLRAVINRCGVITGPYQMGKVDQGVIVLWMARHLWNKDIKYFGYGGTGKQVRDIMHVQDLFRLVDYQINNMDKVKGKLYNAGGGTENSVSLKELTTLCAGITGNKVGEGSVKENRAGDIPLYISDNNLVEKDTGWSPKISPVEILGDIYEWMKKNENQLKPILDN